MGKVFQNNNWEEKVAYLEAIRFIRENEKDYQIIQNEYPLNIDRNKTIHFLEKIDSLNEKIKKNNKVLMAKIETIEGTIKNQTDSCLIFEYKFKIDSIKSNLKYAKRSLQISYAKYYNWQ